LSTIHGDAEILITSRLSESQVRGIVRNMYGPAIHMRELLDEVLTRFRGTDKGAEPSDLGELVTNAVDKVAVEQWDNPRQFWGVKKTLAGKGTVPSNRDQPNLW
jgi:hypothetical protein